MYGFDQQPPLDLPVALYSVFVTRVYAVIQDYKEPVSSSEALTV